MCASLQKSWLKLLRIASICWSCMLAYIISSLIGAVRILLIGHAYRPVELWMILKMSASYSVCCMFLLMFSSFGRYLWKMTQKYTKHMRVPSAEHTKEITWWSSSFSFSSKQKVHDIQGQCADSQASTAIVYLQFDMRRLWYWLKKGTTVDRGWERVNGWRNLW